MFLLVVSGKIAHTSGQTHDLRWITESTAESNKWEHNIKPSCNWTYVHSTEAMVNFEMEPYCRSKTDFWWRNHEMKPLVAVWWNFIVLCNMYTQSVHSAVYAVVALYRMKVILTQLWQVVGFHWTSWLVETSSVTFSWQRGWLVKVTMLLA